MAAEGCCVRAGDLCRTGRNIVAGSRSDISKAADLLSHLCGAELIEMSTYLDLMTIRTRTLLSNPHHWMTVERLAAELIDKQTVQYKAAKALANQAREDFFNLNLLSYGYLPLVYIERGRMSMPKSCGFSPMMAAATSAGV